MDQFQPGFLFVKCKGEVRIKALNCKKRFQHGKKTLPKRYINRQAAGDQSYRNQRSQINKDYSLLVGTMASKG